MSCARGFRPSGAPPQASTTPARTHARMHARPHVRPHARKHTRTHLVRGAGIGGTDFGYTGLFDGLVKAARQEGVLVLWRGLLPRLLLKSCGSSIWYSVYMALRAGV